MKYPLAKRLKDAGFPQEWREGMDFYDDDGHLYESGCEDHGHDGDAARGVKIPSLSELIEACGEDFDKLQLEESRPSKWFAYGGEAMFLLSGIGSTPEEAVANLWLSLNEKKS